MNALDPKTLKAAGVTPEPEPVMALLYCEILPPTAELEETNQRLIRITGYDSGKSVLVKVPASRIASDGFTLIPKGQAVG